MFILSEEENAKYHLDENWAQTQTNVFKIYMQMYTYVCVMYILVYICQVQRSMLGALFHSFLICFMRQVFTLNI